MKELKPSTRQRFVALEFGYPPADIEAEIVQGESGVAAGVARALVAYAGKVRALEELALAETVSTRLLVTAGQLIAGGLAPRNACQVGIVQPLTDDETAARTLQDLADLTF